MLQDLKLQLNELREANGGRPMKVQLDRMLHYLSMPVSPTHLCMVQVNFTGHSFGGAICLVLAMKLLSHWEEHGDDDVEIGHIVVFGMPRVWSLEHHPFESDSLG